MSSFIPKPILLITIKGLITEEELKTLKKEKTEEIGNQYRVIFEVMVHKYALKQKYLQ
jgi:hypothetical protein